MLRSRNRFTLFATLCGLSVISPATAQQLTWNGPTSGTQNLSSNSTVQFTSPGTYTVTVSANATVIVRGVAGGGGGGGVPNNCGSCGGSGGGGGAADAIGEAVTLQAGKTYAVVIGAGGSSSGSGTATSFKNTTNGVTYLDLGGGGRGANAAAGGSGGVVNVGVHAVAGGPGGSLNSNAPANLRGAAGGGGAGASGGTGMKNGTPAGQSGTADTGQSGQNIDWGGNGGGGAGAVWIGLAHAYGGGGGGASADRGDDGGYYGGVGQSGVLTIEVAVAPSSNPPIIAVPATVVAGSQLAVTVSGAPGYPTDWIGMYAAGSPTLADWSYLNGSQFVPTLSITSAMLVFTAPASAGSYEFRLIGSNSSALLATSTVVTVTAPPSNSPAQPLPSAQLVLDTFTGTNGTRLTTHVPDASVTGAAWTATSAAIVLSGSRAATSGSFGTSTMATIDAGVSDVTITADYVRSASGGMNAVVFRSTDANNYWIARVFDLDPGSFDLGKVANGVTTWVGSSQWGAPIPLGTHQIKIVVSSSSIKFYFDNSLAVQATDAFNLAGTTHGLQWYSWGNGAGAFDNFQVTGLLPPPAASVAVTPAPAWVFFNGTQTLSAQAFDQTSAPIANTAFRWTTSNAAAVTVSATSPTTALVRGVGPGSATITATPTRGAAGSGVVTVDPGSYLVFDSFTAADNTDLAGRAPLVSQTGSVWTTSSNAVVVTGQRATTSLRVNARR